LIACTSTPPLLFDLWRQSDTLCGWLLPGPVMSVPAGAPRETAICAAVLPLPYRFETSGPAFGVPACAVHVAAPADPPVRQCVQCVVVELGLTPAWVDDELEVDELEADWVFFAWPGATCEDCAGCAACGCAAGC